MLEDPPLWKTEAEESLQWLDTPAGFDLEAQVSGKPTTLSGLPFTGFVSPPGNPSQVLMTTYVARGSVSQLAQCHHVSITWQLGQIERCRMLAKVGIVPPPNISNASALSLNLRGDPAYRTFTAMEVSDTGYWEGKRREVHDVSSMLPLRPGLERFLLLVLEPYSVDWEDDSKKILSRRKLDGPPGTISRWVEEVIPQLYARRPQTPNNAPQRAPQTLPKASVQLPRLSQLGRRNPDVGSTPAKAIVVIDSDSEDDNLLLPSISAPRRPNMNMASPTKMSAKQASDPDTIRRNLFPNLTVATSSSSDMGSTSSDVEMDEEPQPPVTPPSSKGKGRAPLTTGDWPYSVDSYRSRRYSQNQTPSPTSGTMASGSGTSGPHRTQRQRLHRSTSPSLSPTESAPAAPVPSSSKSPPIPTFIPPTPPVNSTAIKPPSAHPPPSVSADIWDVLNKDASPPFVIAYNPEIVNLIERHNLPFGVRFELARGVSREAWTWQDVKQKLMEEREVEVDPRSGKIVNWYMDPWKSYSSGAKVRMPGARLLRGNSVDVSWRVAELIQGRERRKRNPNLNLWRELDREEKAMKEGLGRGLGLLGPYEGYQGNWFGGRLQIVFRLDKGKDGAYKINVEPIESRRSHYFARALGSTRMAQLRIPDDYLLKDMENVKRFVSQKFLFMGTTYVPFHAKDGNSIYLLDNNVSVGGMTAYRSVCEWHNPITMNFNQPIAKYSTRNTIGFSNSIPVFEFEDEDIIFDIPDIHATSGLAPGEEPASHQIMTDGCGFINRTALLAIKANLPGLEYPPTAIQGRIAGAKGLWILHPNDTSLQARIWIRPSQNKIKLKRPLDRAHRILNLLSTSHPMKPCSLSMQSIFNLAHNGVTHEILASKLEEGLNIEVRPLMDWGRPHAMEHLYDAVARMGAVGSGRASRCARNASRALGLSGRDRAVVEHTADDGVGEDDEGLSLEWTGRNPSSGMPIGMHEALIEALQSGFSPVTSDWTYKKLYSVIKGCISKATADYRLPVPQSTTAMMIPDPLGILEENEVFFKPSIPLKHPTTSELLHQLEGEVLVGRYPLRLASDMQKVVAVNKVELQNYVDVLILPVKGARSMASILSGGDYDGDEDIIIWDREIVESFHNHPVVPEPPDFLKNHFEKQIERVGDFCSRVRGLSISEAQRAIFDIMLLNVCDSKVGLYSKFHDCAVWKHGLNHEMAVLLGYMFNTVLDAPKTGLRVKPEVFREHKAYDGRTPWDPDPTNPPPHFLRHRDIESPFVLNHLKQAGKDLEDKLLAEFEDLPKQLDRDEQHFDHSLLRPYQEAVARAQKAPGFTPFHDELQRIVEHVNEHRRNYSDAFPRDDGETSKKSKAAKAVIRIPKPLERFTRSFIDNMPPTDFTANPEKVAASYAYSIGPSFAFNVAFRTLCLIKAESSPSGIAPCTRANDEAKITNSRYMRVLAEGGDD